MLKQNVSFEEVFDNYAIRIIYKSDAKNEKFIAWKIYSSLQIYTTAILKECEIGLPILVLQVMKVYT
jgi:hypothetical protein